MALIAGTVELDAVMSRLATGRPVFHSEADFQHAFAQMVHRLAPEVAIRLEVRQQVTPGGKGEYVDLICTGPVKTFIEFKYATARWSGTDGITDERFYVREHAAMDLIRKHFIFDVERLERFTAANPGTTGLAVLLTNAATLWKPPTQKSRDRMFRVHDTATLTGELVWGNNDHPPSNRTLRGTYTAAWNDYSTLPGPRGTFRWLGWEVTR